MRIVQILIRSTACKKNEVLVHLKNIESPGHPLMYTESLAYQPMVIISWMTKPIRLSFITSTEET